jgi:hypothetical protein
MREATRDMMPDFSCHHAKQGQLLIIRLSFPSRALNPAAEIIRPRHAVIRNRPVGTMPCSSPSLPRTVTGKGHVQKGHIFFVESINFI